MLFLTLDYFLQIEPDIAPDAMRGNVALTALLIHPTHRGLESLGEFFWANQFHFFTVGKGLEFFLYDPAEDRLDHGFEISACFAHIIVLAPARLALAIMPPSMLSEISISRANTRCF